MGIGLTCVLLLGAVLVFLKTSPQFGGKISKNDVRIFEMSKNFKAGKFVNESPTKATPSLKDAYRILKLLSQKQENTVPTKEISVNKLSDESFAKREKVTRFTWTGHSSFLLQMAEKNILLDPMFSEVPAPHPWLGTKRFSSELPIEVANLPYIDAVIYSHDHYDHLDYETVQTLKNRVGKFYVPLGVGKHLRAWGVAKAAIVELDWWQEAVLGTITLVATPARHFSGRSVDDTNTTLWASWVLFTEQERIFFSGDSGYDSHFKRIGAAYGPFDLALIECGQYNDDLPDFPIHMYPEQTVQASLDVRAKYLMPIHWAAFKLNQHPWKEPILRLEKSAAKDSLRLVTPEIGAMVSMDALDSHRTHWWEVYE
ncbi:conserved hypothetical protein [Tenacibaculum litopenaei]|uniref:MBL fold metallo-hydrolase n=1 Tax=Tenacibaculum litopenaei TaxID=396016 RepID=UPI00389330D5